MNRFSSLPLRWLTLALTILTVLACSFLQGPATDDSSSPSQKAATVPASITEPARDQTTDDESAPNELDPLDRLLNLRSIRFNLTTGYPDKTSRSTHTEVDAAGNLHLIFTDPPITLPDGQENSEEAIPSADFEVYGIDGAVYQFDRQNNSWLSDPKPVDYLSLLSDRLHGSEGPGLWLDLLPDGSLQPDGQETIGGFTTNKYAVNGTVAGQTITGALWFDTESHALVKVELHVPAKLLSTSQSSEQGELTITLEAQKVEIPAMSVPAPLATPTTP